MTQHYADNLVRNPEQFASGLGKNVKNRRPRSPHQSPSKKKRDTEKRDKKRVDKKSKFIESVTQGPSCENDFVAFTQGPIEWLQRQFSAVNDGVRDTLRAPFDEVINFLKDEDVMASVRMLAERAQDGTFKVVFGLDFESLSPVILILLVLTLPFLSRVQVVVLVSLFSLFCVFKPSSISSFGRYLFDRIKSFVGFGSDVVQDALSFSTCYRFIVSCFAMWNMRVRFGDDATSFDKILSTAKAFKSQVGKVEDMYDAAGKVQEVLKDSLDFVSALFGLKLDTSLFQGETWFEIEQLNNSFLALKAQYDKRENVHSVASQLMALEKHGLSMLNRFKAGGPAYIQYRDAMMRIVLLRDELAKIGCFGNSTRQEPLFVVIAGQAGIGKSTVSNLIQATMVKEVYGVEAVKKFSANDSGSFVYSPNQESKFLDGYNNQGIVLLDDFASSVEACQNWTQQIIHLVNTQPHQTPQASLERKGAVYFDSKVILATTNVSSFSGVLGHMHSKDAVARRMHLCLKSRVKPEFALPGGTGEPKVDMEKVELHRQANPDVAECFWLTWSTFNALSGFEKPLCKCGIRCTDIEAYPDVCSPATFKDVLKLIVQTYRYRRDFELAQRERNRKMMEFLEDESDTLDCIEKAFTQSGCGVDFCYACAPSQQRRDTILIGADFVQYQGFREQVPEGSQEDFLRAWIGRRTRIRESVTNKDVFRLISGSQSSFRPVCWVELAGRYNLVSKVAMQHLLIDYTAQVSVWSAVHESSRVLQVAQSASDYFRTFSVRKIFDGLKLAAQVVAGGFVFWKLFVGFAPEGVFSKKKRRSPAPVVTQSADLQHDQVVRSLLGSNILAMYDEEAFCGYAFGIGGSLVLMNRHIYDGLQDHESVSFFKRTSRKHRYSYTVNVSTLVPFASDSDDLVCVDVKGFHCQNVVHHLVDDGVRTTPSFNIQLTSWSIDDDVVTVETSSGTARLGRPIAALSPSGEEYVSVNTVEYDLSTENGQCGAMLTRIDSLHKCKLVGLHAAGSKSGKQGFGIILTKRFVESCFEHFGAPVIQYASNSDVRQHFDFCEAEVVIDDLQVVGKATPVSAVYKSEITKSPLYGELSVPPEKKPAALNPFQKDGALYRPVVEALKSYSRGGKLCNMPVLEAASAAYIHELNMECTKPLHGLLSFEEAVMGSKDKAPYLKPINRGTASGSPSRFHPGVGSKKREAFGFDENYTFDTPGAIHIKKQYDEALEALEKGPIPMIFVAFPKDELRPTEKVKQGKTRVVFSCDTVATLLIRRFFGCFASWYQDPSNRYKNSSAVGMNVADQFELKTFLEKMGAGSLNCDTKAGDYSSFDKDLPSYVLDRVWDVFVSHFGPLLSEKDLRIARNVFLSFTKPFIQYEGCLIEWDNSNPSGNPITTIINTICNNIVLRYGVARSLGCETFSRALAVLKELYIRRIIEYICYGDDNVWKIDRVKCQEYGFAVPTYASVSKALQEMGLVYTDEVKSDLFDEGHRTVYDVSFLKRKLRRDDGRLLMCLSLDTLVQNVQWAKKKDVDGELFRVKVEGFLDELAIHPQPVWDQWYSEFYQAAKRVDPKFNLRVAWSTSRADRMQAFLARGCEYW